MNTYRDFYPEGYYKVRVLDTTIKPSKSGLPYFTMKVEVLERADNGSDAGIVFGGHRYVNLYTSEKTRDVTGEILTAAGFDRDTHEIEQLSATDEDHLTLAGFIFKARCSHGEYNNKPQEQFSLPRYWSLEEKRPAWADSFDEPTAQDVASLNALLGFKKRTAWTPPSNSSAISNRTPFGD